MDYSTSRFRIGIANRPCRGEQLSGDAWSVDEGQQHLRMALIDGAGHGEQAHRAAHLAIEELRRRDDRSLAAELQDCHDVLRATRGAVMTVVHLEQSGNFLEIAGVGNIETLLVQDQKESHVMTQRGMLGYTMPRVRPVSLTLAPGWILILHSDGVRSRFSLGQPDLQSWLLTGPQALAEGIVDGFHRVDDDATVIVVMSRENQTAAD